MNAINSVQPYLFFNGRCEEALEFYRKALNAEVTMLMRFKDNPGPNAEGGDPEKIMHANFIIGGTQLMASDGQPNDAMPFQSFALALNTDSQTEAKRCFAALEQNGQAVMPLAKTFFSPLFGMVTDQFGILWMILVSAESKEMKENRA